MAPEVRAHAPRGPRGKSKQRANGARGLLARAQLEHLPEQDKHRDDGGRLEIDRDRAVRAAKARWKNAGQEERGHAVEPSHAGAHGDEREHVEIAGAQRLPGAQEERPPRPENDRRCECELEPARPALADHHVQVRDVGAHFECKYRRRQRKTDPEPPAHLDELGTGPGPGLG